MSSDSVAKDVVSLDPNGGQPVVEVFFGNAQPGRFNVYLQDPSKKQTKIGSAGTTQGGETAAVPINKTPSELKDSWICVDITVMSPSGSDGQRYLAITTIRQDANSLVSIQQSDDFSSNSQALLVYVRCQ